MHSTVLDKKATEKDFIIASPLHVFIIESLWGCTRVHLCDEGLPLPGLLRQPLMIHTDQVLATVKMSWAGLSLQWGDVGDFKVQLTHSNLGAVYVCLFPPSIPHLICLYHSDITYVKPSPNCFSVFNLSFSLCVITEASSSKSFRILAGAQHSWKLGCAHFKSLWLSPPCLSVRCLCLVSACVISIKMPYWKKKFLEILTSIIASLVVIWHCFLFSEYKDFRNIVH